MNAMECMSYLMYKEKVHRNNREQDDNMHLNGFMELCEIRKMIENIKQKSMSNNMNEYEISNVYFVYYLMQIQKVKIRALGMVNKYIFTFYFDTVKSDYPKKE